MFKTNTYFEVGDVNLRQAFGRTVGPDSVVVELRQVVHGRQNDGAVLVLLFQTQVLVSAEGQGDVTLMHKSLMFISANRRNTTATATTTPHL